MVPTEDRVAKGGGTAAAVPPLILLLQVV